MSKQPKRKLIKRVIDAGVAIALLLILKGEEQSQVLKNKAKSIFR